MLFNSLQVCIAAICLLVNVLTQVLVFRYFPKVGLLKSEYLGFAIGFLSILLFQFYVFSLPPILIKDFIAISMVNLISYSLLGYCYFHFVNLGETARRIRILFELYEAGDGLGMGEIINRYNANEIIEK